jgi:hypothetical protein
VFVIWILVLIVPVLPVHARDLLGRNIDDVAGETMVRCLDHDELIQLIKGKVVTGESVKSHWFGVYYKKTLGADGSLITEIYRKGSEQPLKVINDEQWFVRNDGILCTKQDGEERCRKKVCSADGIYLVVLTDDGTINGVWSVGAEENSAAEKAKN